MGRTHHTRETGSGSGHPAMYPDHRSSAQPTLIPSVFPPAKLTHVKQASALLGNPAPAYPLPFGAIQEQEQAARIVETGFPESLRARGPAQVTGLRRPMWSPAWTVCCSRMVKLHRFEVVNGRGERLNVQAWCCPRCGQGILRHAESFSGRRKRGWDEPETFS